MAINYLDGSPRRRCVLRIEIQADTPERIISMLNWLIMDVEQHGLRESLSGGFDASHSMSYDEDAEITHDTFGDALEEHMRERIQKRKMSSK